MTPRTQRRAAACLLVVYVAFLGVVLGQAGAGLATGAISATGEVLLHLGAPDALTDPGRIQLALNVVLFVPLALLAALTMPRHPWANWVVYAFVASAGVECAPGLILPARSAQYVDVVANTHWALSAGPRSHGSRRRVVLVPHRRLASSAVLRPERTCIAVRSRSHGDATMTACVRRSSWTTTRAERCSNCAKNTASVSVRLSTS